MTEPSRVTRAPMADVENRDLPMEAGRAAKWLAAQSGKPKAADSVPAEAHRTASPRAAPAKARKKGDGSAHADSQVGRLLTGPESREKLYEAYNDLHALAQVFSKPFDAPAILVVGHQTDGKSALVEALMGFQFNHVGGGTKTRRPIALHMKYNSACKEPNCYLVQDSGNNLEMTLEELQEHIENENQRLQNDGQFSNKEITVKIEYKYCPNLTIIDTPGLISAAPGKKSSSLHVAAQQVELMVKQKMSTPEYIILCLEDSSDWSNATTRRLVMTVDPTLHRTVVVSTKFDTRIPQFATGADADAYLHPAPSQLMNAKMLGGSPFFTSVPSGRVGNAKDAVFSSNERFRDAVTARENEDARLLAEKMKRQLDEREACVVGVSKLRGFLEQLLQRRYLESVPRMMPLLEQEFRLADQKLRAVAEELRDLNGANLKERGRSFAEAFVAKLSHLLRGTTSAPAQRFGETLYDEHARGGAFVAAEGKHDRGAPDLANAQMHLYGGAQYNRAMAEFRAVVGTMRCPDISQEEIVNACGVDDFHDGANVIRTACIIGMAKARDVFEPFLAQLGCRLAHILRRMLPISMYLLQRDGQYLTGHDLFLKRIGAAYHDFIDTSERLVRNKCKEDLISTTRYITWSLHTRNGFGLRGVLSEIGVAPEDGVPGVMAQGGAHVRASVHSNAIMTGANSSPVSDVLDSTLWNRQLGKMSEDIIAKLVKQLFDGIRDYLVQAAEMKFNCFFLMPVVEDFPTKLREELEMAYESHLDDVFDVLAARSALEKKKAEVEHERHQVEKLQRKFTAIHSTLGGSS